MTRSTPDAIEAYTVTVLIHADRYLMLERSPMKTFAPLRWTGVGGRVESDEFESLKASALRELAEETGFVESDVEGFVLRRALLVATYDGPLRLVLYATARLRVWSLPECPEGTLHWLRADEMDAIDIIDDTRQVLPVLFRDELEDPSGSRTLLIGLARHLSDGSCAPLTWM